MKQEGPGDVPSISMDYGFMKTEKHEEQMGPMLVIAEDTCGMIQAMCTPCKGTAHPWVAQRSAEWIEDLGYERIILKTDNEPSIVALSNDIRAIRGEQRTEPAQRIRKSVRVLAMVV